MLTLYFSPGACSLASHIGLEETGAPYEAKPILLAKQQQRTEDYLKINPRGKVPALSVDGKILVENTAILTYLARRFPEKKLMPTDAVKETGRKSFWANCQEIDSMFQGKDWIMGSDYTLVDPYALVFYGWGVRGGFPMKDLSAYTAWQERMMKRPTVKKTVDAEQNVSTS